MQTYSQLDQLLHLLCQPIAKINRTFVEPKSDDSHTNLKFDHEQGYILGRWINFSKRKLILGLDPDQQNYFWMDESFTIFHRIPYAGLSIQEIESAIGDSLMSQSIDPKDFTKPLHFEITKYAITNDSFQAFDPEALHQWQYYRKLANLACLKLNEDWGKAAEPRIWPHHFDTGIYEVLEEKMGIGFGLAMEDNLTNSPYFYLAGYPVDGELNYSNLPALEFGEWKITDGWKGAVLSINDLSANSKDAALDNILAFARQSIDWLLNQ